MLICLLFCKYNVFYLDKLIVILKGKLKVKYDEIVEYCVIIRCFLK